MKTSPPELADRRIVRILLVVWCCFIIYGSLIPFRFSTDADFVRSNVAKVQLFPFQAGTKNFSLPDVASNILLFIPFGLLLLGSGLGIVGRSGARRIPTVGGVTLLFATAIELGQLFAAGRSSSGIDVEADVIGALIGAIGACLLSRYKERVGTCLQVVRDEPQLFPIILLAFWLGSGAFYPFAVTLDVSTLWQNLKHTRWIPFRDTRAFLRDRVVDQTIMYALLSALVRSALSRHVSRTMAAIMTVSTAVAFSCALEVGKLLVVGRTPNAENVFLASAGVLLGVAAVPMLVAWRPIRKHPGWALSVLALSFLVYSELTPFAFAFSSAAFTTQFGRFEWMPLFSYSRADAQSGLFDLSRKLLLSGFWGFSFARVTGSTPWRAAGAGLGVGGVLEAAQLFIPSRIPSVGDTLSFGLGAWTGAVIFQRYWDVRRLDVGTDAIGPRQD